MLSARVTVVMADSGAAAFSLLGNETRLRIIRALGDLSDPGEFSAVPFSGLQEAVGVRDNGTFTYHLRKLRGGRFVERADDGYRLSLRGIYVYRGLRAGTFEGIDGIDAAGADLERRRLDRPCLDCGADQSVWVEDGRVHLGCESCAAVDLRYPVPAGGLARAAAADDAWSLYRVLRHRLTLDSTSMLRGFCPYCSGATTVELSREADRLPEPGNVRSGVVVTLSCDYCHWFVHANLEGVLTTHPVVLPFLQCRGVDAYGTDAWRHCEVDVSVEGTDPWRLSAAVERDGDRLVLALDGTLDAMETGVDPDGYAD